MKLSEHEIDKDIMSSRDSERMGGQQVRELKAALAQVTRSERRLLAQYTVTRVLAESATLKDAGQEILRAIGESLNWKLGMFWNVDKQAAVLRFVDLWHAPNVDASAFREDSRERTFQGGVGLITYKAISRKVGGTGLGTKIVKDVVEAHGGRITVESELGMGTSLQITLPVEGPATRLTSSVPNQA